MKRRLNIAGALLHDPELILLDEPTVGVDPQSRNAIFENLEELKRRGKTLVYTTHYMEEAERLCDRVVIIDHGKVIADDTVGGLYRRLPASRTIVLEFDGAVGPEGLTATLRALPGISAAQLTAAGLRIETDDFGAALAAGLPFIAAQGLRVASIKTGHVSLEDVFIALTGHALRDSASAEAA
jgi:ABC-2 type transport system ATP-binding protein